MAAHPLPLPLPLPLPELHFTNTVVSRSKISAKSDSSSPLVVFSVRWQPIGLENPWLGTDSLRLKSSNPTSSRVPKHRPLTATVLSTLPTAKPERFASGENVPKWSWKAIKVFSMAELEARKLKYSTTGTEALLMGILIQGTNPVSKFLWENGITLFKVREETIKLLGKGDMYFFSPEHPPLTGDAQRALDWAVDQKLKSGGSGEIMTTDILLGIWSEVESPGHKILVSLGFNDEKTKELESLIAQSGFTDG